MREHPSASHALAAMRRAGCEGDVFVEDSLSSRVAVSNGQVEAVEVRRERGAGVRVFLDGRAGFSFTSEMTRQGLEEAVERAIAIARLVAADEGNRLPEDPGAPAADFPLLDPRLRDIGPDRKIEMARAAEEAARAADRRVTAVREACYQDSSTTVHLASTRDRAVGFAQTRAWVSVELAATEAGQSQVGWHADWRLGADGLDPAAVGREAARKAAAKLGASPAATRRTSVVLSPEVTASLFGELSALLFADAVLRGRSLLAGKVGERIASESVTLIDDGRHPDGFASAPVDGEGVAARETVLVERGVLLGYLHSTYTATRMSAPLTGNALRGGFSSRPDISRTNLYLRPSGPRAEELMKGVAEGLYVMEVMGLHTINPVTGDFSIGASGLRIESGRTGGPVDRMAVAGNILDLLGSVEAVADDLRFLVTGPGSTVLLANMAVSGT